MSISAQTVLLVLVTVVSLAIASWVARRPRRTATGVLLGTIVGIALTFSTSFIVGFLNQVLPVGQMQFWLASLFAGR